MLIEAAPWEYLRCCFFRRMNMFERIKKWYVMGLWTQAQVQQAVDRGVITVEQYQSIVSL